MSWAQPTIRPTSAPCLPREMTAWPVPLLAVHNFAAVGVQNLAGYVGGIVRGEKDVTVRDLFGLAGALHGDVRAEARHLVRREGGWDVIVHPPGTTQELNRYDVLSARSLWRLRLLLLALTSGRGPGHDSARAGAEEDVD